MSTSPNYVVRVGIPGLQGAGFDASEIRAACLAAREGAESASAVAVSAASAAASSAALSASAREGATESVALAQQAAVIAADSVVSAVVARDEAVAARDAARTYRENFVFTGEWTPRVYGLGNLATLAGSTYVLSSGDGSLQPPGNGWEVLAKSGADGTGLTLLALDGGAPDSTYLSQQSVDGGEAATWN